MMLMHPISLLGQQLSIIILVLGFAPYRSTLRFAAIPILIIYSACIVPRCTRYLHRSSWAALVGGYSTTFLLHYVSTMLIQRRQALPSSPAPLKVGDGKSKSTAHRTTETTWQGVWRRMRHGIDSTVSFRRSGTPEEVRNVPLFSDQDRNYVPPRARFLRHHLKLLVFCYLTLDILGLGADPDKNAVFFAPEKIPFFVRAGQVSGAELVMRILCTLGGGLGMFCSQQGVFSIMALIFVGLDVSEPKYWRPLFGSITEAYTLRRFWG